MNEDPPTGGSLEVDVLHSEYQSEPTTIHVLVPDDDGSGAPYPVVYVLPVEARDEHRFGDGMREVLDRDLHNRYGAVFAEPTFSLLPWYADHPTDPDIRQESYLLQTVVPFVEAHYPVRGDREGRLLLGFSKSGWGAFSLLLRHPEVFGRAAAWDAPLMMAPPMQWGSAPIFGTTGNFDRYRIDRLLQERGDALGDTPRLILLGYGSYLGYSSFRDGHIAAHKLMGRLGIPHVYRDGPRREHDWHSGWLADAAGLLLCGDLAVAGP